MQKFNVTALANTFAAIDLILHPLFHFWVWFSPQSYEWIMNLFVAGLQLQVTTFDTGFTHVILGTVVEASTFWLFGAFVALVYNRLSK